MDSYSWEKINKILENYEKHKRAVRKKKREDAIKKAAENGKEKKFTENDKGRYIEVKMDIISVVLKDEIKRCKKLIRNEFSDNTSE